MSAHLRFKYQTDDFTFYWKDHWKLGGDVICSAFLCKTVLSNMAAISLTSLFRFSSSQSYNPHCKCLKVTNIVAVLTESTGKHRYRTFPSLQNNSLDNTGEKIVQSCVVSGSEGVIPEFCKT